jgi:hypothetical protein
MTRLRGRSLEGQRLVGKAPHGHRKTTTFVAAVRNDRITAPLVIDGAARLSFNMSISFSHRP